jgi:hypothetical protein
MVRRVEQLEAHAEKKADNRICGLSRHRLAWLESVVNDAPERHC